MTLDEFFQYFGVSCAMYLAGKLICWSGYAAIRKLKDTADFLRDQAERDNGALIEGEGFKELRSATQPRRGVFE